MPERTIARRLLAARALLLASLAAGFLSWRETAGHVVDPLYVLPDSFLSGAGHARYHALREAGLDVAVMTALIFAFLGPNTFRVRAIWWLLLILLGGAYLPFWIGMPFDPTLSAPSPVANAVHLGMATLGLGALLMGRPAFPAAPPTRLRGPLR